MSRVWGRVDTVKEMTGPAMMRRKQRFEKCAVQFPDRADWYREQIVELELGLRAIKACHLCGRPLKGEESQERGYGPECAKKIAKQEEQG
jgi:hypothetical protein